MRRSLRLTPKVTLTFVLFAVALLAVVGILAYQSGRSSLEEATLAGVVSTAIEKEASLERWVSEAQNQIANIADSPMMRQRVATLLTNPQAVHADIVSELLPLIGAENTFAQLSILEPVTGKVLAATAPNEENTFKEDRSYFINGQIGPYVQNVYFSVGCQCPAMTASAPIKSSSGDVLAVIAGDLNIDYMGVIINRSSGQYETADAYLVNKSSLLVTQPRLISDPAILQRGIHTAAVRQCLTGQSGSIQDEDYRGVPAMAAYRWLPNRNFCLVVKIDQAEALQPVDSFGRTLFIAAGIALLGASILAVTLAQTITRPILSLQNSVSRFGQGDLEIRLPENSQDELGTLAHEFNTMANSIEEKEKQLQDYTKNLEDRVSERTTQLSFLADASRMLSESLDYADQLKRVAELAVPKIADLCIVDIVDKDGVLQQLTVVHKDPKKAAIITEMQKRLPASPNAQHGIYHVLQTGKAEFYPDIPEGMKSPKITDVEVLNPIRELGFQSSMTVPLLAHGHSLGTLTLIMAESGRHYNSSDLELAEDLARRAALLIDNAKLFTETQELNTELEQRVQERTAHLTAVNKELEAFSYSVSHDLRAPLRAIDGFSQAVVEDYYDTLDDMGKDFLSRIRKESQRMGQLIDDLIGLSRFTRTELNFATINLSDIAREIIGELKVKDPDREIEIVIADDVKACGDERLIRVALQNLLNNAWKFTAKAAKPRIEFGSHSADGKTEYFVRDNGAGFDMAYVNKLFGAFQRLHSMEEFAGTGIGLATVQRIMHRHGGFIRAEAKMNEGAAFYFTLGENNCG